MFRPTSWRTAPTKSNAASLIYPLDLIRQFNSNLAHQALTKRSSLVR